MIEWPRDLTPRERELISLLLREGLPGDGALRDQVSALVARGNAPLVHFEVDPTVPRSSLLSKGVLEGTNPDGHEMPWSSILLWVEDGALSALELVPGTGDLEGPSAWPSPDEVVVTKKESTEPARAAAARRKRKVPTWPMTLAVTAGMLVGIFVATPEHCVAGRCQPVPFEWIPFLVDLTIPESWVDGPRGGGVSCSWGHFWGSWGLGRSCWRFAVAVTMLG